LDRIKISDFIERGNAMEAKAKQEQSDDRSKGRCHAARISSREYAQWMSEIKVFMEREIKGHPLHKTMSDAYFFRDSKSSAFDDMMGCLQVLLNDDEDGEAQEKVVNTKTMPGVVSLENLLSQDILKCTDYLQNPQEEAGRTLYTQITARYDTVIKDFGNGLYSYIPDYHFYDPEIDISTINHNLNILLQKMITYQTMKYGKQTVSRGENAVLSNKKVFIVHGHDNEAKEETARIIEKLGLQAIILHEQASSGNTIIEKIERYSDVGFAVILYTPCDKGHSKNETIPKNRARQNVVFEHGYLIGKLGRNRVCALVKGEVETPGDISGVVYVPMDSAGAWKNTLIDEMKAVGFVLDKNNI